MSRSTPQRVAVVGGGVLGCSTALHLARGGVAVRWLVETVPGSGASGRSLAWLNSAGRYSPAYHALRLAGLERYRALGTGGRPWLGLAGGLRWARSGEADELRGAHEELATLGYPTEWLSREDVAARLPGVDAGAVPDEGAMFNAGEGWVDLPSLMAEMAAELRASGGVVEEGVGPVHVSTAGDRVTGVRGSRDSWPADAVVVATGAGVPAALAEIGVHVPEATSAGLVARTTPVDSPLRVVLNTPRVALRPAPDGRLVMDAGWSEREVSIAADGSYTVPEETLHGLLEEGRRVLDGRPHLELDSYGVGAKPIPGDGEPVLGRVRDVAGYHVAFTHSGATLALVVGELLADEVIADRPLPALDPFRPDRFRS
jgi:glycine/D-amino acid oxidase-like deaminating enzyme